MSIGPWQLLAIVVIVLVIFGPSRLPGLGKSLGEAIRGFKKGLDNDEIDVTADTNTKKEQIKHPEEDHVTQSEKTKSRSDS
jgi:sec-independent protein translocase protein TatA